MTTTIYDMAILCKLVGIPFDLEEEKRKRGLGDVPDEVLISHRRKISEIELTLTKGNRARKYLPILNRLLTGSDRYDANKIVESKEYLRNPVDMIEKMKSLGYDSDEIQGVISENVTSHGGLLDLEALASEKINARLEKHLPTRHNQKTHGKPEGGVESAALESDFQKDILSSEKPAEKWKTLSDDDKDRYANAKESIQARINGLTEKFGEHDLNASMQDIASNRLKQVDGLVTQDVGKMLADRMGNYAQALTKAGISEASAKKMIAQATDALLIQESESLGRQLGDHGIRHVLGDVDMALDILSKHPAYDDPKAIVATYVAGIFHDTGYTTPPGGKVGMDGRHPAWSLQHYEANMKDNLVGAIGQEWADKVGYMIKTHDSPDVDWDKDPVTSALRVADNMALFHKEKLPGLYKYAPQNIKVLMDLGEGKIDAKTAQTLMKTNIQSANLPKAVTERLFGAASEVFKYSPKFTLGMLGGHLESVEWKTDHLEVTAYRNNMAVRLQKHLDLGQRQFTKLASAYLGEDLSKLSSDGFTFDKNGKPVIRFTIIGEEIKSLLRLINEIEKNLVDARELAVIKKSVTKSNASLSSRFEDALKDPNLMVTTTAQAKSIRIIMNAVHRMRTLGFTNDKIWKAIDENWATEGGISEFEAAVEKIISRTESVEKSGTREGALKAWKTRRRSLLDKLRDAISNRDAKAVVRLKQQLASGAKIAQEVYGKEE